MQPPTSCKFKFHCGKIAISKNIATENKEKKMKLSEKLTFLRKDKGWSQEQLANKLSVSRQAIYKWEADIATPEIEKLKKLSTIFGISLDDLLDEEISLPNDNYQNEDNVETEKNEEIPIVEINNIVEQGEASSQKPPKKPNKLILALIISVSIICLLAIVATITIGLIFLLNGHDHDFTEWKLKSFATCKSTGEEYRECKKCGEKETRKTPLAPHAEIIIFGYAPTCEAGGLSNGKKCDACNEILSEQRYISALGHNEKIIKGEEPTCTKDGISDGKKCTTCGKILVNQEIIKAKGHTIEIIDKKDATCTETGLTEGKKCSVCKIIIKEQTETPIIPHTYDNDNDSSCNVCDFIRDITCSHENTEILQAIEPTCTKTGLTEGKKCTSCEEIIIAQSIVDPKGHTEQVIAGKPATCTETGLTEGAKCSVCGAIIKEQTIIPLTEHSYDNEADADCNVCDFVRDVSCKHNEFIILSPVEPTCTTTGLTEGKKCSSCEEVFQQQSIIEMLPHSYVNDVCSVCYKHKTLNFTLNSEGKGYIVSSASDIIYSDELVIPSSYRGLPVTEIAAEGFANRAELLEVYIPSSVKTIGNKAFYNCSNLTSVTIESGVERILPEAFALTALTKVFIPDTVTVLGPAVFDFNTPFGEESDFIVYFESDNLPTDCSPLWNLTGSPTYHYNYSFGVCNPNGHSEVSISAVEATCTESGLTEGIKCSLCEKILKAQSIISAKGHTEKTVEGTEPTCTNTGLTDGVICSVCNIVIKEQEALLKTDHNYYNNVCTGCGDTLVESSGLSFTINSEGTEYAVSGIGSCKDTDLVIPATYKDLPVTSIASAAFINNTSIKSVIIPDNVKVIEMNAFRGCSYLNTVDIGNGVVVIGGEAIEAAFYQCTRLKNLKLGNSLKVIPAWGFAECTSLESVVIPNSVEYIGAGAFGGCTNLSSVVIGSGLKELGANPFSGCEKLLKVDSNGAYYVDKWLIYIESTVESIVLKNNTVGIAQYALSSDTLQFVTFNSNLKYVGSYAFYQASLIESIELPEGVVSIGEGAFWQCTSLEKIVIPTTCTKANSIFYAQSEPIKYAEAPAFIFNQMWTDNLVAATINSGAEIASETFKNCTNLTSITIADTVTTIGAGAFNGCTALQSIKLPSSIKTIGESAFYNCTALSTITLNEGLTTIGENVFTNCEALTTILIPASVTKIDAYAFMNCDNLTISCKAVSQPANWNKNWNYSDCTVKWGQ